MDFVHSRLIRKIKRLKKRRKETAAKILSAMKNGNSDKIGRLQDFHTWLDDRIKKYELQLNRKEKK